MRFLSVIAFAGLFANFLPADEAKAQGLKNFGKAVQNAVTKVDRGLKNFDEARQDAMSLDHRAGRDFTKLYIHNETNRTLWVAIRYYNSLTDRNATYLERPTWHTNGWWKLNPGEKVHAANADGSYYYVSVLEDRGDYWSGEIQRENPRGRGTVPYRAFNFGDRIVESHTLSLTD